MNKITLIIIWFFSFAILGEAQIYHGFNANGSGEENEIGITNDLSACDFAPAFSLNHTITEIAFTPDGSLYACKADSLFLIDTNTGDVLFVNNQIGAAFVGMSCDNQGILYLLSGLDAVYSYNPMTDIFEYKGTIPLITVNTSASALTYKNGVFYVVVGSASTASAEIWQLDMENLSQSAYLFDVSYDIPPVFGFFIVRNFATKPITCDSSVTYIYAFDFSGGYYFELNFQTGEASFLCGLDVFTFPYATHMTPMASLTESLYTPCDVVLDLDENDSSGALENDYDRDVVCTGIDLFLENTDLYLDTYYPIDSIVAWIESPLDNSAEQLSWNANNSIFTEMTIGNQSVLKSLGTATVTDFLAAMENIEYTNILFPNHTGGERAIHFLVFSNIYVSDTATVYLDLPVHHEAGEDGVLEICKDESPVDLFTTLMGNPDGGGTWNPLTMTSDSWLNPLQDPSGIYLYIQDNGECPADTASVNVTIFDLPALSLGADQALCSGQSISLSSSTSASSYLWQDGSSFSTFNVTESGVYWLEITDTNGCQARDSIEITVGEDIMEEEVLTFCEGEAYDFNGQMIFSDTSICTTSVSSTGCDSVFCLTIDFLPNPHIEIFGESVFCEGEETFLSVSPATYDSYVWSNGATSSSVVVDESGEYTVIVTGANGCTSSESIFVEEVFLTLDLGSDKNVSLGDSVFLSGVHNFNSIDTFWWTPTLNLSSPDELTSWATPTEDIGYELTLVDASGCWVSDDIFIKVNTKNAYYVPNAFSPNGDGYNDYFTIYPNQSISEIVSFQLFNRWGAVVFSRENINAPSLFEGWDGVFNGKDANKGVYVYFIKIRYINGKEEVVKGDFTLLK